MTTKIQKWGNSQGLRVSKETLLKAQIQVGDSVDVQAKAGQIIIKVKKNMRKKYKLEELLRRVPTRRKGTEESWGAPAGREVW